MSTAAKRDQADAAADPGELAGRLRTVINRLAFHLRGPASERSITPTRLAAIAALELTGPLRPGDLAARLGVTSVSVSRLAEALEEADLVRREPDADDRRACLLSLTEHGASVLEGLRREGTSRLSRDILRLDEAQRAALLGALPVLEALADNRLSSEP